MAIESKDAGDENDKSVQRWDGNALKLDDFDKMIARWCRKQYGTILGNQLWENSLPDVQGLHGSYWNEYCESVWDVINDKDSHKAKGLWEVSSGFWNKEWHLKWRTKQYDKLFDKVEASVEHSASLEVANLGMSKAHELRAHLFKQFGGAGEDIQARQERFEAGMPKNAGGIAFPAGTDVVEKLRELEAERVALYTLCPASRRVNYEYGKKSTLVKIVLRHLRPTAYNDCIKALLSEIKMRLEFKASIPVWNDLTEKYETLPTAAQATEDWDYRNYHEDWLPEWEALKSKLVSVYKEKQFQTPGGKGSSSSLPSMYMYAGSEHQQQTPSMFMPGGGMNPKVRCFGCGAHGHRKGDPGCPAGPEDWHDCCPPKFLEKAKKGKKKGVDGLSNQKKSDGVCWSFRDTGKCKYGPTCKFKHERGGQTPTKKVNLTKSEKKKSKRNAVKALTMKVKKKAKQEGKELDDNELADFIASCCYVRTIPRDYSGGEVMEVDVTTMEAVTDLLDVDRNVCHDSGSAAGISVQKKDFVWLDESAAARGSVNIRGPSVGKPGCEGRGPLVYVHEEGGVPYGLIDPEGVCASAEMNFRVTSAQLFKKRGVRVIQGKFDEPDVLECVRTGKLIKMIEAENIMCMETHGKASDIEDSPQFRKLVDDIRLEKVSPLVDLTPYLKGGSKVDGENSSWSKMSEGSYLTKLLLLTTTIMAMNAVSEVYNEVDVVSMVFNEARASPEERSRLWCRRFAYCDTNRFGKMASMPEYGDFPSLPRLNEDNVVGDEAKFTRRAFKANDPAVTMDCPPWWRVYVDGYGGQNSLGGESYEGAVGSYLFVCCSTGSTDARLYASHEQFPVALHQFLRRVESEHFKVQVIYVDTFSVNISVDVEEVCALYGATIVPVSAGTPQEMAFAESMVRVIKRMSTAMLAGAPHLPKDSWACADKYAVFLHDVMPQSTRNGHCPWYLRTGRKVNWKVLPIHVFGAPCAYAPMEGPMHKRAPISKLGHFMGVQWPATLIRRVEDGKIVSCARQKMRAYEKAYLVDLDQKVNIVGDVELDLGEVKENFGNVSESPATGEGDTIMKDLRPELDKNQVTSAKSLREYRFKRPGQRVSEESKLEMSASIVGDDTQNGGEGLYVDGTCNQEDFECLTKALKSATEAATKGIGKESMRKQVIAKLKSAMDLTVNSAVKKGQLKVGKRLKGKVSADNIVSGKRKRNGTKRDEEAKDKCPLSTVPTAASNQNAVSSERPKPPTPPVTNPNENMRKVTKKKSKGRPKIKVGDVVSLPATAFDGDIPGSYSAENPEASFGKVKSISKQGMAKVEWFKDEDDDDWVSDEFELCRVKDLTLEVRRTTVSKIIVLLVEGEQVAFEHQDKNNFPKNFFELLVKHDWRKWVASVKKELEGWDANNAVTVVNIEDVPKNAKVVPLGELYSIKRDGRYKFRQYLMGNLLREGVDYKETFSTTVSGSGLCTFYSLATTCEKEVWGWDAVCGYLQSKEQYDVYAFLPSHHEYSSLEYEELAVLRKEFLELVSKQGVEGLRKFAAKHKRDSRTNPKEVYKCNSSIYGAPSAGHEFEMLIHSVHTDTCGCTQTQPEPSIYVRIVVDKNDRVVGYLIAAAFVDDLRFFGTIPERDKYMKDVRSRLKVTFEEPPVTEFVSIETYQCLETNTCELKMPPLFQESSSSFRVVLSWRDERKIGAYVSAR